MKKLHKHETDVKDITTRTRIARAFSDYQQPGNGVRAAAYYNEHTGTEPFRKGESSSWVFVDGVPEGFPATKYMAYRSIDDLSDYSIDWHMTLEKLVSDKLEKVYTMLEWDLEKLVARFVPKVYW